MGSSIIRCIATALVAGAAITAAPPSTAQQVNFTLQRMTNIEAIYTPGGVVDVTVTLNLSTSGTLTAMGLEETIPSGWSFVGVTGGTAPFLAPQNGEGGLLEFAWFPLPDFPLTMTYRLAIPQDSTGTRVIRGEGLCRIADSPNEFRTVLVATPVPGEGSGPMHSADWNGDNILGLSELLRVIQLYNIGGFHCAPPDSPDEDGYAIGAVGDVTCAPHTGDYSPQDWELDLGELLRIIQFYNSAGYRACPSENPPSEDGFCVGLED